MAIQANIRRSKEALATVKAHCMALHVKVTKEFLFVKYPDGFRLDGLRVSMANGLTWACEQAVPRMEKHWKDGL